MRSPWGSITTLSRGKHVLRWVQNTPEGRKRRSRTFHGTRKEASLELSRIRMECSTDAPCPTMAQAHEMWYRPWMDRRLAEGRMSENTGSTYERAWAVFVEPRWGRVPLSEIRPADVQSWLLGIPHGSANHALVVARKVVDFAVQFEAAESNKFRVAYEMPAKVAKRRKDVLTLARADEWLGRVRGLPLEPAFILACFGGCRTGESLGVKTSEVEMRESHGGMYALVPIVRMVGRTGDFPMPDGQLKNAQSVRTTVVPPPYSMRLAEIISEREFGWLADRGDGCPMNGGRLNYAWERVGSPVPFANLRNSWRTLAQMEWGVEPDVLELLMGHVLPGVTGRHYMRPEADALMDRFAARYAEFLRDGIK